MKKIFTHRPRDKTVTLLFIFAIVSIFTISVGNALLFSEVTITGDAYVRVDEEIRVTNISMIEATNGAYETYNSDYAKDTTKIFATLPTTSSSLTYEVTITNKSNKRYQLTDITEELNSNQNISYEIIDLYINDVIEANSTITFKVKVTTIANDQIGNLIIKYHFDELNAILLADKILIDNPNVSVRTNFNTIFTTNNNGNTIYKAVGQDNKISYYFAGQVTNNYVKFGQNNSGQDLWWRIVRINEDNSVRLLYAGLSPTDTSAFISTAQAYNVNKNMSYYSGYEYAVNQQHGLGTDSNVKKVVDNWYLSNLLDEGNYLSKTAIYCNDRTTANGYNWRANGTTFFYSGHERLTGHLLFSDMTYFPFYGTPVSPTFVCSNNADKFTVSETTGNGALEYPIALITVDEVAYAGGLMANKNTNYYIASNASTGASKWCTMSLSAWVGDASEVTIWFVDVTTSTGKLDGDSVSDAYGVRPVISLKSCVEWKEGTSGTAENPYEVTISDTCASLEN